MSCLFLDRSDVAGRWDVVDQHGFVIARGVTLDTAQRMVSGLSSGWSMAVCALAVCAVGCLAFVLRPRAKKC